MAKQKTNKNKSESIAYSGEVKIKLKKGNHIVCNKTIKNMGTLNLFNGIALALLDLNTTNYIPKYIGIGSSGPQNIEVNTEEMVGEKIGARVPIKTTSSGNISNITENEKEVGKQIEFNALIPYSRSGSVDVNEIGLFGTQEGNSLLARVWWDENSKISIEAGMDLIVTWSMSIKNKG